MMIRRNVLMTAATCAALLLPARAMVAQSPCAKSGFAFVSSGAIMASIPEFLQADSLVAKDKAAYMLEVQKLKFSLDSESQAYADKSTLLNATQKAAEIKKLQAKGDAYQARGTELEQKLAAKSDELLQPIRVRVQAVLDGIRAEMNCAVIFDVSGGTGGIGIASADKSLDLTDKVVERLKANAPAKPPVKPAGKP